MLNAPPSKAYMRSREKERQKIQQQVQMFARAYGSKEKMNPATRRHVEKMEALQV